MAEDTGSSNSSIVAIFAIMLIVLIGAFFAWQMGVFGGRGGKKELDINVKTGQISQPAR
jgi:LPXTG-motif cell wall-anchored protein